MSDTVRIASVGLNGRGLGQTLTIIDIPGVEVVAVCDVHQDLCDQAAREVEKNCGKRPATYTDYKKMLEVGGFDAVLCCTTWITHAEIAAASMKAGYHVGFEVGGFSDVEEAWELVRTAEEAGRICMMLENCCYCLNELTLFNMVKQGMFGEIVHCTGGYCHDLRDEILYGKVLRHGRLKNFIHRNGELYPTHQLGPISKLLGLNRGNRVLTLTSVSTKARGLSSYLPKTKGLDYLKEEEFREGDVVDTILTCANGETVLLTHECSLPRPYSRKYTIHGTKGTFEEGPFGPAVFFDKSSGELDCIYADHPWAHFEEFRDKYEHPLWKEYKAQGVKPGHDGVDWLVLSAFIESVRIGKEPPIDVYDGALWGVITALSEQSVAMGGATVPVPDFTRGKWIDREPYRRGKYCLEEVCEDFFE